MWRRDVSGQVSGNWYLSEAALCDWEWYQVKCLGTDLNEAALCDWERLHNQVKCLGIDISLRQHYSETLQFRTIYKLLDSWG